MRQVKFRAWDIKNQKMIPWERLHLEFQDGSTTIWIPDNKSIEDGFDLENFELMQFTGIKDKNGTEVYEGDVVSGDLNKTAVVKWMREHCAFIGYCMEDVKYYYLECGNGEQFKNIEVIGNIHEDLELLK